MKKELSFRHRLVCAMPFSLLQYLIDYKCLDKYLNNTLSESALSFTEMIENSSKVIEQESPKSFFTAAFVWDLSPEGYDYWYRRAMWYETERNIQKTTKLIYQKL